jgi:hypothetical protein
MRQDKAVSAHTLRGLKEPPMVTPQWSSILEALTPFLYVAMVALLVTILSHGQAVLVPVAGEVAQLSTATLASEVLVAIEQRTPDLVCITAMPPGGLTQARYLCKRLRTQFPELRILVVRPGLQYDKADDMEKILRRLTEDGANKVASSVTEARTQATQLLLPTPVRPVEPDSRIEAVQLVGSPA